MADTTVAESDKTWASYTKVPAGLMDISFSNPFEFPLELCWVDLTAGVSPICYGTVAPSGEYNMSSFAGHNFITKRLAWTAAASTAAAAVADGGGPLRVSKQLSGHEWETPAPASLTAASTADISSSTATTTRLATACARTWT